MSGKQNTWIDLFQREAGIRRAILLHGDTLDVYEMNGKYLPIQDVIVEALRSKGFTDVVLWDRFSGAQNVAPRRWEELRTATVNKSTAPQNKTAITYDMGLDDEEPQTLQTGNTPPNIDDFLSIVYYHLTQKNQTDKRIAFILDWSQYLFGTNSSLSEEDRQRLLILSKAVNEAPLAFDTMGEVCSPSNMLVLLSSKLGNIPPLFYQGNACAKDIAIPSPNRSERKLFLEQKLDKWNLLPTPQPGTPQFADFVDATDNLSIRDLMQLAKLSRQIKNPLTFEKLINLYRYGEQKSPWEDLSKEKLRNAETQLQERVKGQDDAVKKVAQVIIRAFTGLSGVQHSKKQRMPKGILFFVGPTGVGKTELAKTLAEFLFGDEEACIRFDMSEFNHEQSDQRLTGAPPGYVGYEEGGQLTNAVKKRPFSVLLFDEIEKAHPKILDKFLQILEDGRLTDGKGDTVQFSETIIIFTSNIGAADVKIQDNFEQVKNDFIEKVKEHFTRTMKRPELLNRIGDNIVPFNFITGNHFLLAIAQTKLKPIREKLREKYGITDLIFQDEQKALPAMFATLDKSMGGRGVGNEIQRTIIDPLSLFLFGTSVENTRGKRLIVSQADDGATFTFHLE